jgi:hypothetical protein
MPLSNVPTRKIGLRPIRQDFRTGAVSLLANGVPNWALSDPVSIVEIQELH